MYDCMMSNNNNHTQAVSLVGRCGPPQITFVGYWILFGLIQLTTINDKQYMLFTPLAYIIEHIIVRCCVIDRFHHHRMVVLFTYEFTLRSGVSLPTQDVTPRQAAVLTLQGRKFDHQMQQLSSFSIKQQSGHKVLNDAILFEHMMFVLECINMLVT